MSDTTIFKNGNIYTLDPLLPVVESIVVRDGKIVDLGSNEEMLLRWGRADVKRVDLEGMMVTPGLIDSHLHLSALGLKLLNLDLSGVTSKKEMLNLIKERASDTGPDEWLIGRGWDENLFYRDSLPTLEELDNVTPHCPLFLTRICGHAFLVNSKAFARCGVNAKTAAPPGGEIVLDSSGNLTGLILETASQLFREHMPVDNYRRLKDAVKIAMDHALSKGLTSVHTEDLRYLNGFTQTHRIYQELLEEQYCLRSNLLIYHPFLKDLRDSGMKVGDGNDYLKIGAIKVFIDGALGRRTAKLSTPYSDAPYETGQLVLDEQELFEIVKEARNYDMPIAAHVIGDYALEIMLDTLDQFPSVTHRDRLIHTQILRPSLIKRLKHSSRIADIQPRFLVSDFPWVIERVGVERISNSYAWKTMLKAGIRCAGGSDAPVEPIDPLLGIHAAVMRKGPKDTHQGWNTKERLTIKEGIELFTIGGAYATSEEGMKGTLSRGKYADMTVYSKNLFDIQPEELLKVEVMKTIIGGNVCYER
jgi:predicted amidohydrolase YtcJ